MITFSTICFHLLQLLTLREIFHDNYSLKQMNISMTFWFFWDAPVVQLLANSDIYEVQTYSPQAVHPSASVQLCFLKVQ